jgi:phage shock protein A
MSDLFKKLNVLVKSSLNDLTGASNRPARNDAQPKLGADFDRDVRSLRARINDAVAFEDELKARVRQLEAEVERWDAQADAAVQRGDDASARYAVEQMQRVRQRLTIAGNDLREHQLVTQELVQRVNTLEAALADARRAQAERTERGPAGHTGLNNVLNEARERMNTLSDVLAAKAEIADASTPAPTLPPDSQDIEDDLSRRRQRLSK